jgi:hypothetical protein
MIWITWGLLSNCYQIDDSPAAPGSVADSNRLTIMSKKSHGKGQDIFQSNLGNNCPKNLSVAGLLAWSCLIINRKWIQNRTCHRWNRRWWSLGNLKTSGHFWTLRKENLMSHWSNAITPSTDTRTWSTSQRNIIIRNIRKSNTK